MVSVTSKKPSFPTVQWVIAYWYASVLLNAIANSVPLARHVTLEMSAVWGKVTVGYM